jgi:hypothetical protein
MTMPGAATTSQSITASAMRTILVYAICLLPVSVFSAQLQSTQDKPQGLQLLERNAAQQKPRPGENRVDFDNPNAVRDSRESMMKGAKQQTDRRKAEQDTEAKIVEIQKDIAAQKARSQSKASKKAATKADEYIR